uniref:Uncharacterized protein n=1 Tax=Arundo donax TaxID=35708 RepID=A0A0A9CIU0_ARUDO
MNSGVKKVESALTRAPLERRNFAISVCPEETHGKQMVIVWAAKLARAKQFYSHFPEANTWEANGYHTSLTKASGYNKTYEKGYPEGRYIN